jgi:hypothetical protein
VAYYIHYNRCLPVLFYRIAVSFWSNGGKPVSFRENLWNIFLVLSSNYKWSLGVRQFQENNRPSWTSDKVRSGANWCITGNCLSFSSWLAAIFCQS